MEYVLVHRGGRGQNFLYELIYDGVGGDKPYLPGLLAIDNTTTTNLQGLLDRLQGSNRGQTGTNQVGNRGNKTSLKPEVAEDPGDEGKKPEKHIYRENKMNSGSYHNNNIIPLVAKEHSHD